MRSLLYKLWPSTTVIPGMFPPYFAPLWCLRQHQAYSTTCGQATEVMSHGNNTTPDVTPGMVSAVVLWDESFNHHKLALRSVDKSLAAIPQTDLTYDRTIETLEKLSKDSRRKSIPRCLVRLKPALNHLLGFSSAISSMAQVHANPMSLIWGSIEILLKVITFAAWLLLPIQLTIL